jgi:hypothetical protein
MSCRLYGRSRVPINGACASLLLWPKRARRFEPNSAGMDVCSRYRTGLPGVRHPRDSYAYMFRRGDAEAASREFLASRYPGEGGQVDDAVRGGERTPI